MTTRILKVIVEFTDLSVILDLAQQLLQAAIASGDPVLIQQVSKFLAILS